MTSLKFEGKGFAFFKIHFLNVILSIVSLSLLYPWSQVRENRYLWAETSLGGSPFSFNGGVKKYFNGYMRFLLVFVLTLLFDMVVLFLLNKPLHHYPFLISLINYLIIITMVLYVNPICIHGTLNYLLSHTSWRSVTPSYKGKLSELTPFTFRSSILTILTLGIYTAWFEVKLNKYLLENMRFGSLRFSYNGEAKPLFKIYLKGFFLGLITCGIYNIWFFKDYYAYTINHIVVKKGDHEFSLKSDANSLDVFEMMVGNALIVLLTLGIGSSWAYIRLYRFLFNHCIIPADFNIDSIEDLVEEETVEPSNHWLDKRNPVFIV
jgi:uncharacterized membrane protein YjgN (DUF898 family)